MWSVKGDFGMEDGGKLLIKNLITTNGHPYGILYRETTKFVREIGAIFEDLSSSSGFDCAVFVLVSAIIADRIFDDLAAFDVSGSDN